MRNIPLLSLVFLFMFIASGCSNDYLTNSEIQVNVVDVMKMKRYGGEGENSDFVIDDDNTENEYREWLKVAKSEESYMDSEIETGIPVLEIEFRNKQRGIYISHSKNGGYLKHGTVFYKLSEEHLNDLYKILSVEEAVVE
ncbi:hypothetical protein N780_01765 [Pontibacillus chungwhensis BH030062]|uniref:Lipoprotein n=1 Tax=Pontibacillus chungwhensis BH030062 TaxID=1385513 RepID=A0A0A2V063_9BACI|nr:hypothetical protein [Pontibacillus chungwhensis]KGP92388.1 hypothetical protein N780_01765 [Pontibacillus chungwhensis BH030062]